jgi:hypothetical protein
MGLNLEHTANQFDAQISICKEIFIKKNLDYGTSWRVLRPSSITDQIFIKAQRIKSIEKTGISKINEGIESEFRGIVNYAILAVIQLRLPETAPLELNDKEVLKLYIDTYSEIKNLMLAKNHDYGEAWREMRVSSFTDIILMRIMRIKQIEDNKGVSDISEGVESNYMDIMNYAMFALIKLNEAK